MALLDPFKELDRLRREQEPIIKRINTIHSNLQQVDTADKCKEDTWHKLKKLKGYYNTAQGLAEMEQSVSLQCVEQLNVLIPGQAPPNRKKPDPNEKKRKRVRADVDSARLSSPTQRSAMPSHANLITGDEVAARVAADDAENHEWIVVKLIRYDREANKYDVLDEEPDDEGTSQRKYKLPASCIIPFPKRADVSSAPDFQPGTHVLAVYPCTTALYKAAVVGPPRKKRSEEYLLQFDGDEEEGIDGLPTKPVPFYHVVQLPDGHRQ